MEFFSEIYGCYYEVVKNIVDKASTCPINLNEMERICHDVGFEESSLFILPKLLSGEWHFLKDNGDKTYSSVLYNTFNLPLTLLQKCWLKSLLNDTRICLFFSDSSLELLKKQLSDITPLWKNEYLYYYDRYMDGDDYSSESYRQHFRSIVDSIQNRHYVDIIYNSSKGNQSVRRYIPLKIEYSPKNDMFRLLTIPHDNLKNPIIMRLNINNIEEIVISNMTYDLNFNLNDLIRRSYYKEPVRLLINNERNALERTMLHFANYEKETKRMDNGCYECLIYYDLSMETELLIEILSFGPTIKVTGPDRFLRLVKERVLANEF